MKQFRIVAVVMFCALFAFSSSGLAMSSKKVSGGSRDVASARDIASYEHESKGVPQLITYEELKSLSPEKRADYIAGVRAMIVQLAEKGGNDFPMFANGQTLEETYSLLEALLPKAYAQETFYRRDLDPKQIAPRLEKVNWLQQEVWTCDSSEYYFDKHVGTCVNKKVGKLNNIRVSCPAHHYEAFMNSGVVAGVFGATTHKYCVPKLSWEKYLAPKRKKELQSTNGAKSVASAFDRKLFGGPEKEIGQEVALGATQKQKTVAPHLAVPVKDENRGGYNCYAANPLVKYDEDLGTCAAATTKDGRCAANDWKKVYVVKSGWTESQRKFFCVTPASWARLSEKRQAALEFPTGPNAASASDREQAASGSGRRSYAAANVQLESAQPAPSQEDAPSDNPATPVVERSEGENVATGGAPCGGVSKMTCGDVSKKSEKRKAAADWWKNNSNACIFAGNISAFSSKDHKENTCASVTSFSKPKLSCKEGVICNPVIFGAKEDGSPHCSTKYAEATSDCNAKAGAVGSNAWLEKNISSVKNEWNKLREGMTQVCGRNAVREYFCDECNIMMERLGSLRLLALERGGDGLCHAPVTSYENAVKGVKPAAGAQEGTAQ